MLQDEDGDPASGTRSRPVSTTPASGRSTRVSKDIGRAEYRAVTDDEAMRALRLLSETEGIIRRSRAPTRWRGRLDLGRELGSDGLVLVNLSGRGDKDMDTAARYFGLYDQQSDQGAK
ncbi:Tryptophan synthase beta chain OS=Streptomyces antimycoticus OX=68175 GN=trpB PE=3 SV=1 [Streptomyces antimycoticus]